MKLRLVLVAAFAFVAMSVQAQDVDEILANYFENTGGLEAWNGLQSMKINAKMPTPQGDFPFVIYAKRPDKSKVEIDVQGTKIVQAFDGSVAWALNPLQGGTAPQKLDENMTIQMKDQSQFDPVYLNYSKKGHEITLQGTEEIDGVECYKLQVVKYKGNEKEESTEYHFFDSENFVPIMIRQTTMTGPLKGQESETFLSDYQETDAGVIMPFYNETRVNGQPVQTLVIASVVANEDMSDDMFAFPSENE